MDLVGYEPKSVDKSLIFFFFFFQKIFFREAMLAEMGVAIGVDGHTVGLFQPRKVITN